MPLSNEPCVVFVEELGEKRSVPREFLQPLPLEQVKPWALPYRHYRNLASVIHNSKIFSFTGNGMYFFNGCFNLNANFELNINYSFKL